MATLTITVDNFDGAAFEGGTDFEVADVLRRLADKVQGGVITPGHEGPVRDVFGARCGTIVWTD